MTKLAERLKKWRVENRLSQKQAADVMSRYHVPITVSAIRSWEQGRPPGDMAAVVLQGFLRQHSVIKDPPPRYPGHRPERSEEDKAAMRVLRDHGATHVQIGEKFGIGYSAVSRILSGKSHRKPEKKSVTDFPENV